MHASLRSECAIFKAHTLPWTECTSEQVLVLSRLRTEGELPEMAGNPWVYESPAYHRLGPSHATACTEASNQSAQYPRLIHCLGLNQPRNRFKSRWATDCACFAEFWGSTSSFQLFVGAKTVAPRGSCYGCSSAPCGCCYLSDASSKFDLVELRPLEASPSPQCCSSSGHQRWRTSRLSIPDSSVDTVLTSQLRALDDTIDRRYCTRRTASS